jgi:hypothetical protein
LFVAFALALVESGAVIVWDYRKPDTGQISLGFCLILLYFKVKHPSVGSKVK